MIPGARIQAVIELLNGALTGRAPLDVMAGDYFRNRRYIGSKDRADIAERVYRIARAWGRLHWWVRHSNAAPGARVLALLALALIDQMSADQITALFDDSKHGPKKLSDDEQMLLARLAGQPLTPPEMDTDTALECPPEFAAELHALWGDTFADQMRALLTPAPLDIRINPMRVTRDQAQKSLRKDDVTATPTPYSPWGLRINQKVFLANTKAFREGFVDIQDEGSQLIALVCAAAPGMQILDYCAGGGGKTLALAAAMSNKGRIVAMDNDEARLAKAVPRLRRAGVSDIVEVRPLSDERHRKWFRRQKETFDICLVDAPCSATGTWRRNPDSRWRAYGPKIEDILKTQAEILDRVAGTVKPGGRLVYATCSLLQRENEDQVAAFLKTHPEYRVMPLSRAWPLPDVAAPGTGPYLRLTPHDHNTDGFFAAVLERI